MTIMARLHTKGLLSRRREGKTDYYTPAGPISPVPWKGSAVPGV